MENKLSGCVFMMEILWKYNSPIQQYRFAMVWLNMLCLLGILIELHLVKRNGFQQTTRSYTRPFHGELTKDNKALRATTRL